MEHACACRYAWKRSLCHWSHVLRRSGESLPRRRTCPATALSREWAQARADVVVAAARRAQRGIGTLEPAQVEVDLSGGSPTRHTCSS